MTRPPRRRLAQDSCLVLASLRKGRRKGWGTLSTQPEILKFVSSALRTEIAGRLRVLRAPKARTLMERGSRSNDVFFLLDGRAQVLLYSSTGREVCVNDIGPGDVFGEVAALDSGPRSASIV